jgi:hypothetical protein
MSVNLQSAGEVKQRGPGRGIEGRDQPRDESRAVNAHSKPQ